MNSFETPEIIILQGTNSESGELHFIERCKNLPFSIKRSFWITDVPNGTIRGVHAHREETQVLIAIKGELNVILEGKKGDIHSFLLDKPNQALILPAMYWSEVRFGEGSILLGLSNKEFSENDYIRDKNEFKTS